jgi:hypothetical protein
MKRAGGHRVDCIMFFPYLVRQCSPYANCLLGTSMKHALRSTRSLQRLSGLLLFEAKSHQPQSRLQNSHQIRKISQATMAKATEDPYRLPRNVKPVHYNLLVKTDLEALRFEGHVAIE